jgi:uncharacterized protein
VKIIGLEEHLITADVIDASSAVDPLWQDLALKRSSEGETARRLADLGADRLAAMDETGLDVSVLSLTAPGVQNLEPAEAVALQTATNDRIAEAVRAHPDRLQGFATLATPSPPDAAAELQRAVTRLGFNGAMLFGRTRDRNLDDPEFWPIFEAAEALRAPLYLHPQTPVPGVRAAYYNGLGDALDSAFATFGIGWHYETGMQLTRMILRGVFDRFPDLQVIVGHWGEVVLFYLERLERLAAAARLERPLADYFRSNVFITPSGMYTGRYLRWAVEVVGVERIMFSTDYPFVPGGDGAARRFLADADLDEQGRELVASGNWERLTAGIRR